jgi:hypothetical protein
MHLIAILEQQQQRTDSTFRLIKLSGLAGVSQLKFLSLILQGNLKRRKEQVKDDDELKHD